jgi:hypothetical protein
MILGELWTLPASYFASPVWLVLALMALGFGIGNLTGALGLGGGFLVTPMLMTVYGIDPQVSVASGLCFIVGSAAAGLRNHARKGNWEPTTLILMALGSTGGALFGKTLNFELKAWVESMHLPFRQTMQILYLPMLVSTIWLVLGSKPATADRRSLLQRLPVGPNIHLKRAELPDTSLPGLLIVGFAVGTVTGLLGIGGGVLVMPILLAIVGLTPHRAVGTSLGIVLFGATAGTLSYAFRGMVNLPVAMSLLVTSILGIQTGSILCGKLQGENLRKYFVGVVVLAILVLALDLAGVY